MPLVAHEGRTVPRRHNIREGAVRSADAAPGGLAGKEPTVPPIAAPPIIRELRVKETGDGVTYNPLKCTRAVFWFGFACRSHVDVVFGIVVFWFAVFWFAVFWFVVFWFVVFGLQFEDCLFEFLFR